MSKTQEKQKKNWFIWKLFEFEIWGFYLRYLLCILCLMLIITLCSPLKVNSLGPEKIVHFIQGFKPFWSKSSEATEKSLDIVKRITRAGSPCMCSTMDYECAEWMACNSKRGSFSVHFPNSFDDRQRMPRMSSEVILLTSLMRGWRGQWYGWRECTGAGRVGV